MLRQGRGNEMKSDWTPTSEALPPDDCEVEFVLDHRDMAMAGTYRQRMFASRWSEYEMTAVREWRLAPVAGPSVLREQASHAA